MLSSVLGTKRRKAAASFKFRNGVRGSPTSFIAILRMAWALSEYAEVEPLTQGADGLIG
jgi:hypothetical protein